MAASGRASAIFGTSDWKRIYQTFRQADFASYDYESLRKSFVDYLKVTYPENYNDYIESSEYVALLDIIAFMGQALAFRGDLNARENFIDTAERRDSVLKLANLVGYTAKRNLPAGGFLKVTAIQTTESINDTSGLNLANVPILWNDPANPNWRSQFNVLWNAALRDSQIIGRPGNSKEIDGINTDEYSITLPSNSTPVFPYSSIIDGTSLPFELVSVTSVDKPYLYEKSPAPTSSFNILYRNDKLGYTSADTGFFIYFKQGTLKNYDFGLTQKIANQTIDIDIEGVNNNTDTWLYNIDRNNAFTEWKIVENIYANNDSQNISKNKNIFSVDSRFNDQVTYIFGDNVFGNIPLGAFRAYVRSSNSRTYSIQPTEMQNIRINIPYISRTNRTETMTVVLSLQAPVSNALARESITSIKERAPARYYTQNRMVNGEDYNNFPFTQFSSIIKSKAISRSSSGVSRGMELLDPTGKYSSTTSFADDGVIYTDTASVGLTLTVNSSNDVASFLSQTLMNELAKPGILQHYVSNYSMYDVTNDPVEPTSVYWKSLSSTGTESTGYFYSPAGPIAIGTYSTRYMRYVTTGALIKVEAPLGYYFDEYKKLVFGIAPSPSSRYFWTPIVSVIGDGYNFGTGALSNGLGPVTIRATIPSGCLITRVIPSFSNVLSSSVQQSCIQQIALNRSFSLVFDNSLLSSQERYSVVNYPNTNSIVDFVSLGSNRYSVNIKSLAYYFGSVSSTRFGFDQDKVIYDTTSGRVQTDQIAVLKYNTQYGTNTSIGADMKFNIISQAVESDGYPDDFAVEITPDTGGFTALPDPTMFSVLSGYDAATSPVGKYAFFQKVVDVNLLARNQLLDSGAVVYSYPSKDQIEMAKYGYPSGQIFYAYSEDIFYVSSSDSTVNNILTLTVDSTYSVRPGRSGISFMYTHLSDNTSRVDPASTNLIDIYLVTQAYQTAYFKWILDSSGKISEPAAPTMTELNAAYNSLSEFKMLSDSMIMNSVKFKPLFGAKASPKLRATIKVIKNASTDASDSEIKSAVLAYMNEYFLLDYWDFGDTFYFTELASYIHGKLTSYVNSVVLVPNDTTLPFGSLYEIHSAPYEIFVNAAQASDILIVGSLNATELSI